MISVFYVFDMFGQCSIRFFWKDLGHIGRGYNYNK